MKEEKILDSHEEDNLRLAMESGTLPPSGELERYFLPPTARQMLPLALQLESAVRRMHNPTGSMTRHLDPFAAKWLEKLSVTAYRSGHTAFCISNIASFTHIRTGNPDTLKMYGNGREAANGDGCPARFNDVQYVQIWPR